jgi:hypothetical protein
MEIGKLYVLKSGAWYLYPTLEQAECCRTSTIRPEMMQRWAAYAAEWKALTSTTIAFVDVNSLLACVDVHVRWGHPQLCCKVVSSDGVVGWLSFDVPNPYNAQSIKGWIDPNVEEIKTG